MSDPVAAYWEQEETVSIIDKNLHALEIEAVVRWLQSTDHLADVGCGDGAATAVYAQHVRWTDALERSATMRAKAVKALAGMNGWVLNFDIMAPTGLWAEYDCIVSQRMLINLASWDEQKLAIRYLYSMLKPGGRLILVENTNDAFQAMNDLRVTVGLDPVPQHWHNRFFDYDQLMAFLAGGFQVLHFEDFGLYYLLTRVFTQMFASFTGFGVQAVKDPIFAQADAAAKTLMETIGKRVSIGGARAFGPIQVWVLRKELGPWTEPTKDWMGVPTRG